MRRAPPDDRRTGPRGPDPQKPSEPQKPAAAPEPPPGPMMTYEFRSEKWGEAYGRRIDEMIPGLKSKGVPGLRVGLPAIRGTRPTSDLAYLTHPHPRHPQKARLPHFALRHAFPS